MPRRLLPFAVAVFGLVLSAGSAPAGFIYLALGDSSAFGETIRTQNPSNGDRGYVSQFADHLAGQNGGVRPTVWNLAINGETTSSFFAGTGRVSVDGQGFNTNYDGKPVPYTQQQRLADLFPGVTPEVTAVTVQLGANNLDAVAAQPDFLTISAAEQQQRVGAALRQVADEYATILGDVRQQFPNAELYALGYHNPYNGDPDHPFYPLADAAVQGLNQVIWGVAGGYGATYVDVYGAIHPNEDNLTLIRTWTSDPMNYVHLNQAGYDAAAARLITTADSVTTGPPPGVPEPATVVLVVVGGLTVVGNRLRNRRASA